MGRRFLLALYAHFLRLYPPAFHAEFAAEMRAVFGVLLDDAVASGLPALLRLLARELIAAPRSLFAAHWREALNPQPASVSIWPRIPFRDPAYDGRHSWLQATLETAPFAAQGAILLVLTYSPPWALPPGWYRQPEQLAPFAAILPLLLLTACVLRGLPRWAYSPAGLLLGYCFFVASRQNLLAVPAALLPAFLLLALAGAAAHARRPLPAQLAWLARSVQLDAGRLSFAIYGAMPLILLLAFDDGYRNDRTPWLAIAVLVMVAGALSYCRSRSRRAQLSMLGAAAAGAIGAALANQVSVAGSLSFPAAGGWRLSLLGLILFLLLAPLPLPALFARVAAAGLPREELPR
jgi:hypothetical protein